MKSPLAVPEREAPASDSGRSILWGFLTVFLPLLLLIVSGLSWYASVVADQAVEALAEPQRQVVKVAGSYGEGFLLRPIRNVRGLASLQSDVRTQLDHGRAAASAWLRVAFSDLLIRNPDFAQIRWIGADGREWVRVDAGPDGAIRVTPDDELQDKSDRPYVRETRRLAAGLLYVSPLDLNVEHGRVEVPHRPMIRLAMRTFDSSGASQGEFVLNVDASELLDRLSHPPGATVPVQVLDRDGFWLRGAHQPELEWGFQLGHADQTLALASAQAWQAISASDLGQVELRDGLWSWQTVHPVPIGIPHVGELTLRAVTHLPSSMLSATRRQVYWKAAVTGLLLACLAAALAWRMALLSQRRRRAEQQTHHALDRALAREQERDQTFEFLQKVTNNLPTMVAYWDRQLHLQFANRAYAEWFSRSADDIRDIARIELLGAALFEQNDGFVQEVLSGVDQQFERTYTRPNGAVSHTLNRYIPDDTPEGLQGFIAVTVDITELKEAQFRLEDLNGQLARETARARSASLAKSEFLSNISHEIRTPMNGILGLCYLMEKEDLPPAAREMMLRIRDAGRTLLGLINDVLDFSKIEAGRLETECVPFRMADVLDNLAGILAAAVGQKPVEVVIGPPPPGADFLVGDPLRLGQVLLNLAGNAVKFTQKGEVLVRVAAVEHGESLPGDQVRLHFTVQDTGIGIEHAKLQAIFQPFSQADSSTTRQYGGTGLGLAISSRLVALMGGVLTVESTPGAGSMFHFELTLARGAPVGKDAEELHYQRVLVADDQPTARGVLKQIVSSLGWHADCVEDGLAAVQAVATATPGYDVVVLDWRMPGLDGLGVARELSGSAGPKVMPIVLMVTAFDRENLKAQPGSELVDALLTKPVTASSIYNAVQEARERRHPRPERAVKRRVSARLLGMNVLLADDSELNRHVASRILEDEGATVETASNGRDALAALQARPDHFHVVLMDMQMPVLDGYAATRRIREDARLARLPVVALTAGAFRAQRALAEDAGVDEFVSKPFDVGHLLDTMERLGSVRRWSRVAVARARAHAPLQVLNLREDPRFWNSRADYQRYLDEFIGRFGQEVIDVPRDDTGAMARLAHSMRGEAGLLGLEVVAQLAAEMEERLQDGQAVQEQLEALQEAMRDAQLAIRTFLAEGHEAQSPRDT